MRAVHPHPSARPATEAVDTRLGDLISVLYEEFMQAYGDPELASVAAAAIINDMLMDRAEEAAGYVDAA